MKFGVIFIALAAVVILIFSARAFDPGTVLFIAGTMLIVAFFAASTVLLGVLSCRAGRGRQKAADEHAEIIRESDQP